MKKWIIAAVAALAMTGAASAADVPVKPKFKAPPAPVFNWTGFYVGAHVGYGWAEDTAGIDADGFLGGLQIGYNWQMSRNFVFGIEADIAATDISSNAGVRIDYIGTIRARAGYAADRTLFYLTGGYAYSELSNGLSADGYAIGGGIEWAFAQRWSAKIEYMYHDLNTTAGDIEASTIKLGVNYRF